MSKPRQYQTQLIKRCLSDNYAVVLPTGAGKTLIAVYVALFAAKKHPKRIIYFVTPTVALADQQATVLEEQARKLGHTLRVHLFCGGKKLPYLQDHMVIVGTPQCLINSLERGQLSFSRFSLLILDECHHAVKKHPYAVVMKMWKAAGSRPKVVGLTASPGCTEESIVGLGNNLSCKFQTCAPEDLEGSCHIPKVRCHRTEGADSDVVPVIVELIELKVAERLPVTLRNEAGDELDPKITPEFTEALRVAKSEATADERIVLDSLYQLCLAVDATRLFGPRRAVEVLTEIKEPTLIAEVEPIIDLCLDCPPQEDTPKLRAIWEVIRGCDPKEFSGIIFVDTRQSAKHLVEAIKKREEFGWIRYGWSHLTLTGRTCSLDTPRRTNSECPWASKKRSWTGFAPPI